MNRKKLISPSLDNRLEKFKSPLRPPCGVKPSPLDFYFPGADRIGKDYKKYMKNIRPRPQITIIKNITNILSKTLTCPLLSNSNFMVQ